MSKGQEKNKKGNMNKRIIIFALFLHCLFFNQTLQAQDLDVPLFDDLPPNLGRTSTPLESLSLTPPPLPEVVIPISNPPSTVSTPAQTETTAAAPTDAPRPSAPITLPINENFQPEPTTALSSHTAPAQVIDQPTDTPTPQIFHDVSSFEVANLTLGMNPKEVASIMRAHNFALITTQDAIPPFYATDYAQECRDKGVRIPEKLQKCIKQYACDRNTQYVSEATFKRKNETLKLFFTSNATGNLLYKLIYLNKGDVSLNFTRINYARKKQRMMEFWNMLFDKYGNPDDPAEYIWGNPQKAYMQVKMVGSSYDAYIIMEDVLLSSEDYFEAEDFHNELPPRHTFGF